MNIHLIIIAYYHNKNNIASYRWRTLLPYLNREHFSVSVLTGPGNDFINSDLETIPIAGRLAGQSSKLDLKFLSKILIKINKIEQLNESQSWIENTVRKGWEVAEKEAAKGRAIVVLGTYSPIDSLIAARLLSERQRCTLIQDFRDGFTFESLGRSGFVYNLLRQLMEKWVISNTKSIITVSRPLVASFSKKYPKKRIDLLYNGYDDIEIKRRLILRDEKKEGKIKIGHFGRISASDGRSYDTLLHLRDYIEGSAEYQTSRVTFQMFGEITPSERLIFQNYSIPVVINENIPRSEVPCRMSEMNALLLVTSDRTSVATGKLFEYLFSGKRIILATKIWNEAANILSEINDGDIILDFSKPVTEPQLDHFFSELSTPFYRNQEKIAKFKKSNLALQFTNLLSEITAGNHEKSPSAKRGQALYWR